MKFLTDWLFLINVNSALCLSEVLLITTETAKLTGNVKAELRFSQQGLYFTNTKKTENNQTSAVNISSFS